jgi:two-component system sensor histidine kinase CpxA
MELNGRLYLKLFLWFWLTLLVMLALVFSLPRLWYDPSFLLLDHEVGHFSRFSQQLERKLNNHRRLPPGQGQRWFLIDPADPESASELPEPVLTLLLTAADDRQPRGIVENDWFYAGPFSIQVAGKPLQVVQRHWSKDSPLAWLPQLLAHPWRLGLTVAVISAILCGLLAWRLGRPLQQLRQTALALACGDLDARPDPALLQRRDEVGLLSRQLHLMAETLSSAIASQQQLLRDVSHELRSPLTRLQLAIGLMRRTQGESSSLQRIERESEKLEQMIAELLQLAKMQQRSVERESFEFKTLLQEVVDDAAIEANARALRLTLVADQPSHYQGEPQLLRRAVDNLLRNAICYARGEIIVSLVLHEQSIEIRVEDDGPGVAEEELAAIFRPFYRLDDARTPASANGAGIGMAIVAAAVKAHGGEVVAGRSPLGGLQVRLMLPYASSSA